MDPGNELDHRSGGTRAQLRRSEQTENKECLILLLSFVSCLFIFLFFSLLFFLFSNSRFSLVMKFRLSAKNVVQCGTSLTCADRHCQRRLVLVGCVFRNIQEVELFEYGSFLVHRHRSSQVYAVHPRFDIFHSLVNFSFLICFVLMGSLIASIIQGLNPPFTEAPSDPTYVVAGSDARLKWNYDHGNVDNVAIQYEKSGSFVALVAKDSKGSVQINPREPKSLTGRVTIEGKATLVIKAVNPGDSTRYRCRFTPVGGGLTTEGPVRLIVAGRYTACFLQKKS